MKEFIRRIIVSVISLEAKLILKKYRPSILLVSGSVGKTSTKDALYDALKDSLFIRKSQKSFNSDIGAPLTILGVPNGWSNPLVWLRNFLDGLLLILLRAPYPAWLIIEVGADKPGDISQSLAWIKPNIVVLTRIPEIPVHVEFYASPEKVFQEETSPVNWMTSGTLITNADDENMRELAVSPTVARLTYGIDHDADVRGVTIEYRPTDGSIDTHCTIEIRGSTEHMVLNDVIGRGHVYASLAALAGARAVGVDLGRALASLASYDGPPGRMRVLPGITSCTIVDDTYNSSPAAVREAIDACMVLKRENQRRIVMVLGDMLELGSYSVKEHEMVGEAVAGVADVCITVGVRARSIRDGAERAGMPETMLHSFDNSTQAADAIHSLVHAGDVILVKGSQSIRMERVTKALMQNPESASKLLCRQDAEWLSRA
ncbi:MAG: UDP-N-acetylmuramoyl-tripeptide--D-alanyl-D-alanine ligase [Patescibacteria group bacterium]